MAEGENKEGGLSAEIPDDAIQEALESIDRNEQERAEPGGEETVVRVEVEAAPEDAPPAENTSAAAPEETAPAEREGPSREALIEMIEKLRDESKAARDRMMRIAADADNTRKRALRERNEAIKYGQEDLLRDILVPLDNLERTLNHITEDTDDPAFSSHREGLTLVWRQFQDVLAKHDMTGFSAMGEPFDPNRHEALARTETTDAEPGTIVEEMQRGYMLHDRLLRPALVNVACEPAPAQGEAAETKDDADEDSPCAQIPEPPDNPEPEDDPAS